MNAVQISDTCLQVNVGEATEALECLDIDKPKLEEKIQSIMLQNEKREKLLDEQLDAEIEHNRKLNALLNKSIENQNTSWYEHPVLWFTGGVLLTTITVLLVN